VTGRVRTDQEIVQEALGRLHARDGWVHSSENQLRADAVAALGRLVEALHTAQRGSFERLSQLREASDSMMRLTAERDVAIQERDEWRRQWERAETWDPATEARLERVEVAAREAHHIAMTSRASLRREQFASPAFKQIRDVLAAALSDVTPPSETDLGGTAAAVPGSGEGQA
jgi:hypothetical protein